MGLKNWLRYILSLVAFSSTLLLSAQSIRGTVRDAVNGEPIEFAHILLVGKPGFGTVSGIDGKFVIDIPEEVTSLHFSHISYSDTTIYLGEAGGHTDAWTITLVPRASSLLEAVVRAGEDPALAIIRKAIENKDNNDPARLPGYTYSAYKKANFDALLKGSRPDTDSARMEKEAFLKGGYAFVMESLTEHSFLKPDQYNELVISSKATGFKRPEFVHFISGMNLFGFYADLIPVVDAEYHNPISKGSLQAYHFRLLRKIPIQGDTTYIISFFPKKEGKFKSLEGILHINNDKFAIQRIVASPAEPGYLDFQVKQEYRQLRDSIWFPYALEMKYQWSIAPPADDTLVLVMQGSSYIRDAQIDPPLRRRDFSTEMVRYLPGSWDKDSMYWVQVREYPLNTREEITYSVIDSLSEAVNLENKINTVTALATMRIPAGYLDIYLAPLFQYNRLEGFNPSISISTSDKFSDRLVFSGGLGYSFKGKYFDYAGRVKYIPDGLRKYAFEVSYVNGTTMLGQLHDKKPEFGLFNVHKTISRYLDFTESVKAEIKRKTLDYELSAGMEYTRIMPGYSYFDEPKPDGRKGGYYYAGLEGRLFYQWPGQNSANPFSYWKSAYDPEGLEIQFHQAIPGIGEAALKFTRIFARVNKSWTLRYSGKFSLDFSGGIMDNSAPVSHLFIPGGVFDRKLPLYIPYSFQTMRPQEFISDRYVSWQLGYTFLSPLYSLNFSRPGVKLLHKGYIGSLSSDMDFPEPLLFFIPEKPFLESGIHLENLLRMKYFHASWLGIGAGLYLRHGYFEFDDFTDNLALKLSLTFSTN